jgi:hypothetical protein
MDATLLSRPIANLKAPSPANASKRLYSGTPERPHPNYTTFFLQILRLRSAYPMVTGLFSESIFQYEIFQRLGERGR